MRVTKQSLRACIYAYNVKTLSSHAGLIGGRAMPDQVYDMLSHPPKRFGSVERTCCVASRGKLAPMGKAIRTHKANPSNPRLARTRTSHQNFVEYQDFLNRMYVVGLLTKSTTKAMVKRKIEEREAKEDWTICARGLVDTGGGKSGRDKIVADDKDKGDSTDKQHSSEVIPLSSYGDGTPVYYAPDREIPIYYAPDRKMFVVVNAQKINAAGAKDSGKSVRNVVDYNMMKKQK